MNDNILYLDLETTKDGKITKYDFQGRVFYSRKELMNRFNKSV